MTNDMRQILCTLVCQHGAAALLENAGLCRGLLNEHGITQHLLKDQYLAERLREVNLLVSAIEVGVAAELASLPPGTSLTALQAPLTQRLSTQGNIDQEEACWTLDSWALALRGEFVSGLRQFTDLARRIASVQNGETLALTAGEYLLSEQLAIAKSITLSGVGQHNTIINIRATTKNCGIVMDAVNQLVLQNLTIRYAGSNAADVIWVTAGTITIRQCTISGGIMDTVNNLRGAGVRVSSSVQCTVVDSLLEGNAGCGIILGGHSHGQVVNTQCRENGYHGIQVGEQAVLTVEGCFCSNNKRDGILFTGSSRGEVVKTHCLQNGYHGLYAAGTAIVMAEENICRNNKQTGMIFFDSSQGKSVRNRCEENGSHGIAADNTATLTLERNTCRNNADCGIAFFRNAKSTLIAHNICNGNKYGIFSGNGTAITLQENDCTKNNEQDIVQESGLPATGAITTDIAPAPIIAPTPITALPATQPCKEANDALNNALIGIFGSLFCCFCFIYEFYAISAANKALGMIEKNPALQGKGKAQAALIIAWSAVGLLGLGILLAIIGAASQSSNNP